MARAMSNASWISCRHRAPSRISPPSSMAREDSRYARSGVGPGPTACQRRFVERDLFIVGANRV